jgi:hypothetical protein
MAENLASNTTVVSVVENVVSTALSWVSDEQWQGAIPEEILQCISGFPARARLAWALTLTCVCVPARVCLRVCACACVFARVCANAGRELRYVLGDVRQ